ncbi:MAG TPA: hypothetical protein VLG92_02720 [Candidatus Saccharimonadia bacterium]|nr:hypothetical protein [Candidatus Saccharimonadia bacterium]
MRFTDYEKPEGWSVGLPEVLVHRDTISRLGMPTVNYESMGALVLGITHGCVPSIQIHPFPPEERVSGYYDHYSRVINIDAERSEQKLAHAQGTVRVLAHEAQHLNDYINHPVRTTLESWKTDLCYSGLLVATHIFPKLPPLRKREACYPTEERAHVTESLDKVKEHEQDILFPRAIRTGRLLYGRQLTLDTITKLGLGHCIDLASDYTKPKQWSKRRPLR